MCCWQRARSGSCISLLRSKFGKSTFCINSCKVIHSFCEAHTNASISNCHHNPSFVNCLCTTKSTCMAMVFTIITFFVKGQTSEIIILRWIFPHLLFYCHKKKKKDKMWMLECLTIVWHFYTNSENIYKETKE